MPITAGTTYRVAGQPPPSSDMSRQGRGAIGRLGRMNNMRGGGSFGGFGRQNMMRLSKQMQGRGGRRMGAVRGMKRGFSRRASR